MRAIPEKSKLRYLANNPTGELIKYLTDKLKVYIRAKRIYK